MEQEKWVTINGAHVKLDSNGEADFDSLEKDNGVEGINSKEDAEKLVGEKLTKVNIYSDDNFEAHLESDDNILVFYNGSEWYKENEPEKYGLNYMAIQEIADILNAPFKEGNTFKTLKEAKEHNKKVLEWNNKRNEKYKQNKNKINDYLNASVEIKKKMLKDKDFANDLFEEYDEPLYERFSKNSSGGYSGYSMSNRAKQSYEGGQRPLSNWKKEDILNEIESCKVLEPFYDKIRLMNAKELKDAFLEQSSWHHTGSYYNKTNFYGIKSPQKIYDYIKNEEVFGK